MQKERSSDDDLSFSTAKQIIFELVFAVSLVGSGVLRDDRFCAVLEVEGQQNFIVIKINCIDKGADKHPLVLQFFHIQLSEPMEPEGHLLHCDPGLGYYSQEIFGSGFSLARTDSPERDLVDFVRISDWPPHFMAVAAGLRQTHQLALLILRKTHTFQQQLHLFTYNFHAVTFRSLRIVSSLPQFVIRSAADEVTIQGWIVSFQFYAVEEAMMKRVNLILCICGIAMLLIACNPGDPDNLFETTAMAPSEATSQPSESTIAGSQPTEMNVAAESDYSYGNMQKNIPSGDYMRNEDSVLFFRNDGKSYLLERYALKTGEVSLLCRDATCARSDGDCPSRGVESNLESYHGTLYGLSSTGIVKKWNGKAWTAITKPGVASFWHADDRLYVVIKDSSLLCYALDSKEPMIAAEEYHGFWNTIFGSYLYYSDYSYNVFRLNLSHPEKGSGILMENTLFVTDGDHLYYTPLDTGYLWRCDMDGKNPVQLTEDPVLPVSWNFDAEYFYFRIEENKNIHAGEAAHQLYRFPKQNPENIQEIAELDETIYQVFTVPGADQIFVTTTAKNSQDSPVYIVNQDGSNLHPIPLSD